MSSFDEKATPSPEVDQTDSQTHSSDHFTEREAPQGWMYRSRKIGPVTIPHYASPKAQLLLVAFVCFLCPGKQPCQTAHSYIEASTNFF